MRHELAGALSSRRPMVRLESMVTLERGKEQKVDSHAL